MNTAHAAVWIDHEQAKVFHVDAENFDEAAIHAHHKHLRRDPAAADRFFHEVATALASSEKILIVGPGTAKLELIKHVQHHDHAAVAKIIGVETLDHPTDKQLVVYIRKYFFDAEHKAS